MNEVDSILRLSVNLNKKAAIMTTKLIWTGIKALYKALKQSSQMGEMSLSLLRLKGHNIDVQQFKENESLEKVVQELNLLNLPFSVDRERNKIYFFKNDLSLIETANLRALEKFNKEDIFSYIEDLPQKENLEDSLNTSDPSKKNEKTDSSNPNVNQDEKNLPNPESPSKLDQFWDEISFHEKNNKNIFTQADHKFLDYFKKEFKTEGVLMSLVKNQNNEYKLLLEIPKNQVENFTNKLEKVISKNDEKIQTMRDEKEYQTLNHRLENEKEKVQAYLKEREEKQRQLMKSLEKYERE